MTDFKKFDLTKIIHVVIYEPSPSVENMIHVVDVVSFSNKDEADTEQFVKSINKGFNEGYNEYCFAKKFTVGIDFLAPTIDEIKDIYVHFFKNNIENCPAELRPDRPIKTVIK